MRIIAGAWGGRRLTAAPPGVRPTSDRVKEALFSMLTPALPGARVVDAFAGTGALGLEALSRGAAHATFVDRAPKSAAAVEHNALALDVPRTQWRVVRGDAVAYLASAPEASFDLLFVDPPYAEVEAIVARLDLRGLSPEGQLVLEHDKRTKVLPPPGLSWASTRSYGDTCLSVFTRA